MQGSGGTYCVVVVDVVLLEVLVEVEVVVLVDVVLVEVVVLVVVLVVLVDVVVLVLLVEELLVEELLVDVELVELVVVVVVVGIPDIDNIIGLALQLPTGVNMIVVGFPATVTLVPDTNVTTPNEEGATTPSSDVRSKVDNPLPSPGFN